MFRILIGSLVAAAVTMLLGWVFFGSPLMTQGYRTAPAAAEAQVLEALKTLPETGTYIMPSGETPEAMAKAHEGVAVVPPAHGHAHGAVQVHGVQWVHLGAGSPVSDGGRGLKLPRVLPGSGCAAVRPSAMAGVD